MKVYPGPLEIGEWGVSYLFEGDSSQCLFYIYLKSQLMFPLYFHLILRCTICLTTIFCGNFIGSKVMTTGPNWLIFSIIIVGWVFLFRIYCFRLNRKYGFLPVCLLNIAIFFVLSFFFYFVRIYLLTLLGLHLHDLCFFILNVGPGGQALPLPGPSGPSSESEDSFAIRVLL